MNLTIDAATADRFRHALRNHPAGVALVTATHAGRHVAMTVSSLASVSAEPPLLVFSVSDESSSAPVLLRAETFIVHLLDAGSAWLARLGARHDADRFGDPRTWAVTPEGEPYFVGAPVLVRARVIERVRAGTSTLCIIEALAITEQADAAARSRPLIYHDRTWYALPADTALA